MTNSSLSWVSFSLTDEEHIARTETKTLREVVRVESSISWKDIEGDGGSHLFASTQNTIIKGDL